MRRGMKSWIAGSVAITLCMFVVPAQAAGLVDVRADVEAVFPGPGGDLVAQLEWGVVNTTTDTTLSVLLNGYIRYSNGLRQQVFPPEVVRLGPAEGLIKLGFVLIPNQARQGMAVFHAEARVQQVQRVDHPDLGSGPAGSGTLVVDTDTFLVP